MNAHLSRQNCKIASTNLSEIIPRRAAVLKSSGSSSGAFVSPLSPCCWKSTKIILAKTLF
ncbi:hypothetical protein [Escherichia coli]|uniref:hypothetical protein n=1 Tax=Escherichia coli TaxID=562 RepID=UPI003F5875C1